MWSNSFNESKFFATSLLFAEYQYAIGVYGRRNTTQYKNRFLVKQETLTNKTVNFFVFKGFKLKYFKLLKYSSLAFYRKLAEVQTPASLFKKYAYNDLRLNPELNPLLTKLFKDSNLFLELNTLVPYHITPSVPMVKAICLAKKYTKKKKTVKKRLPKYTLQYVYVPHSQRMAVAVRWFGMLVKVTHKPLVNSFIDACMNVLGTEEQSFLIKIRNQVYAGLAAEKH